MLAAFEQANTCQIILTCCAEPTKGFLDTKWTATVKDASGREPEAIGLDLVSVAVWGGDYKTLMAVVTRLLYALDFQLALNEFERATKKAEPPPAH